MLAQSTARIEGTISDNSGAAVPGATVTATHVGTNQSRIAVTNSNGAYTITPLSVGQYLLRVELSGFRAVDAPVTLTVGQVARVDLTLELGSVSDTVTVMAASPTIEKSTSHIATLIDAQQVEALPLNGRNFTQLATLVPGVNRGTPGSNASGGGSGTDAETFRYSEFGGAGLSVNGLREQFNNYVIEGVDNNQTLVNSIAYLPSPEAIQEFSVITTNAPAEFGRAGGAIQNLVIKSGTNELHGSAFYFLRPESLASRPEFAQEKPEFKNEDFGATAGGPILRNRTFFFVSYHGLRNSIPVEAGNHVTVPTAKMRNGDFSELLDPGISGLSEPVIIYDPATGVPFPNNVIPPGLIDPVGQAYLNVFPMPSRSGVLRNYLTSRQKQSTYDDIDLKLDHEVGARDQMFLSVSHWDDSFSDPGRIPGFQAGFGAGTSKHDGLALRLGETHIFSGNLVNELRVGWSDFEFGFLPVGYGTDQNAAIGIPGIGGVTTASGISLIGGGDGRYIEYLGDFGQYLIQEQTLQISDSVTWLSGPHTVKFGGSMMRRNMAQERTQFGKGFYFFRDSFGWAPGFTGYEVADMLIGTTIFTTSAMPGFVARNAISWENALYVQDDWHVNPRLTLNLGLRYDLLTPYYEEDDKMANYDPATQQLVLPDQNGIPRSTLDTDKDNFGPRLGFNYLINDRTSLRGGYGIFYSLDRGGIDRQLTENPPAVLTQFRFGFGGCIPGACVRISDPIPQPNPVNPANPVLPAGSALVYVPRDSETTEVQQWNLAVQREIAPKTSALLAYVGTRAKNLAAMITSAGFDGNIADRLSTTMYIGESSYDSLQATVRGMEWRGLSYLASYTLGKAENNTVGYFPGSPSGGGGLATDSSCVRAGTTDCNLDLDEGPADYDARHRFTLAGTYALPFARNNPFLGGWNVNALFTYQSGTPFTVFADGRRADQIGDPNDGPRSVDQYFNTSAFQRAAGAQGTAKRNSVRGPGTRTLDLSVFKNFGLAELGELQLRVEAFNIFDTPQY
ncbi:MAG TPA: TonB-dependent receptor, partial [Thermoanaerobaculia bacterium]|nr:TonB-dependent receptor [Thermoanaerobaculia bacterium]